VDDQIHRSATAKQKSGSAEINKTRTLLFFGCLLFLRFPYRIDLVFVLAKLCHSMATLLCSTNMTIFFHPSLSYGFTLFYVSLAFGSFHQLPKSILTMH
jgi:hypothetical protein